jgi:hypothetical protein
VPDTGAAARRSRSPEFQRGRLPFGDRMIEDRFDAKIAGAALTPPNYDFRNRKIALIVWNTEPTGADGGGEGISGDGFSNFIVGDAGPG